MAKVVVRQDHRPRKLGGAILVAIGAPLAAVMIALAAYSVGLTGILLAMPGLALAGAGLWALFPRHAPKVRLIIDDDALSFFAPAATIILGDLRQVRKHTPLMSKHPRLTFVTATGETPLGVAHLTHDARDILNLISIRLEQRGKFLQEGKTDVRGAPNGIWQAYEGTPFEVTPDRVILPHGRK